MTPWIVAALAFMLVIGSLLWRRSQTHEDLLRPLVESHGLAFISSRTAPLFHTGPYPKFEFRVGKLEERVVLGVDLSPRKARCLRVVRFKRPDGSEAESWASLTFYDGKLNDVEWRPELP